MLKLVLLWLVVVLIGRNSIYALLDSGKLKGFKIGKLRRFTSEELEGFVRAQQGS